MSTVFTLSDALFDDFDMVPLTKQGLTQGSFDLEDGNGLLTGWWMVEFDTSGIMGRLVHYVGDPATVAEDDAKTAADTWWITQAYEKRVTGWKTDGDGNPYCYVA